MGLPWAFHGPSMGLPIWTCHIKPSLWRPCARCASCWLARWPGGQIWARDFQDRPAMEYQGQQLTNHLPSKLFQTSILTCCEHWTFLNDIAWYRSFVLIICTNLVIVGSIGRTTDDNSFARVIVCDRFKPSCISKNQSGLGRLKTSRNGLLAIVCFPPGFYLSLQWTQPLWLVTPIHSTVQGRIHPIPT